MSDDGRLWVFGVITAVATVAAARSGSRAVRLTNPRLSNALRPRRELVVEMKRYTLYWTSHRPASITIAGGSQYHYASRRNDGIIDYRPDDELPTYVKKAVEKLYAKGLGSRAVRLTSPSLSAVPPSGDLLAWKLTRLAGGAGVKGAAYGAKLAHARRAAGASPELAFYWRPVTDPNNAWLTEDDAKGLENGTLKVFDLLLLRNGEEIGSRTSISFSTDMLTHLVDEEKLLEEATLALDLGIGSDDD